MSDLKTPLLRSCSPMQEGSSSSSISRPGRPIVTTAELKKRGLSVRHWIRIDKFGNSQVLEVDKMTVMRRCQLPPRDLRLLDPLFLYPSTILGREKAIVVNLEQIRCVITADEVLLLNSLDSHVLQYVTELQRRLTTLKGEGHVLKRRVSIRSHAGDLDLPTDGGMTGLQRFRQLHQGELAFTDCLPFEFRALEVALEAACTFLDSQATELEVEAYPVLDELTSKVNTLNLERVRRLKSKLVTLTSRVQKMRDEIEQLMDDDGDMAEMYLTEKKERMELYFSLDNYTPRGGGTVSAPVSPVCSPPEPRTLEKTVSNAFSHRSRHGSIRSSENDSENIEQLEMLLEAYFVVVDSTLNKLTSLKQYIDDTEDFVNIQLDTKRKGFIAKDTTTLRLPLLWETGPSIMTDLTEDAMWQLVWLPSSSTWYLPFTFLMELD
ncbi:hypothetical protein L7F22_054593 [Adiantum nelumboides]|nr:hypothetical protein [Adiantum nelumboides]